MLVEINNQTKQKVPRKLLIYWAEAFSRNYRLGGKKLSLAFVTSRTMKKINFNYRGQDQTTDVLSFAGEEDFFGEIIIDYAQIKRQAKIYQRGVCQELIFILIHGLLHLLGYDDTNDRKRRQMIALGEKFMAKNAPKANNL